MVWCSVTVEGCWILCGALHCALTGLAWHWLRDTCAPASGTREHSHCGGNFGLSVSCIILIRIRVVPGFIRSLNCQIILVNWRAGWFGIEGAAVGSMEEVIKPVTGNWMYWVFSVAEEALMTQAYVFCSVFQGCNLCSRVYRWLGELLSICLHFITWNNLRPECFVEISWNTGNTWDLPSVKETWHMIKVDIDEV